MLIHPLSDEVLEKLWYHVEADRKVSSAQDIRLNVDPAELDAMLDQLESSGLIVRRGGIELTPSGEEKGRAIIRRHRLAEVLFAEVLQVSMEDAEASACELEHTLTERVVDRVCTFLGHPPKCPHGKAIPRGSCCRLYDRRVEPLISRLADLPIGKSAPIVFIAPGSAARLNRLATLGVVPGTSIRLLQRKPAQQAVYVEDNYFADVVGSRRAGLTPILIDPKGIFPESDCLTIKTFEELKDLLGEH